MEQWFYGMGYAAGTGAFFIDPFVDNGKILAKKVKVGFKTSYIVVT